MINKLRNPSTPHMVSEILWQHLLTFRQILPKKPLVNFIFGYHSKHGFKQLSSAKIPKDIIALLHDKNIAKRGWQSIEIIQNQLWLSTNANISEKEQKTLRLYWPLIVCPFLVQQSYGTNIGWKNKY